MGAGQQRQEGQKKAAAKATNAESQDKVHQNGHQHQANEPPKQQEAANRPRRSQSWPETAGNPETSSRPSGGYQT